MRILFVISSLKKCGPVNQLYELLCYTDNSDHEIVILTLKDEGDRSRISDFYALGIQVKAPDQNRNTVLHSFCRIKAELKNHYYDLICSQGIKADFICAIINSVVRLPFVSIIHNYIYPDYRDQYSVFKGYLMSKAHLWALSQFDHIIAVSGSVSGYLRSTYLLDSHAIPNGVAPKKCVSKVVVPKRRCMVGLYVGPLIKRKSVDDLLQLFSKLSRNDYELHIVGDGDQAEYLIEKYSSDSRIKFLGFQENTTELYLKSDFYVSASRAEGLPMSVLEALSYGLVCLLSDITPHQEIKTELPNHVSITDFSDVNDLNKFIDNFHLNKLRNERIFNFRGCKFSATVMANSYLRFFSEITKEIKTYN